MANLNYDRKKFEAKVKVREGWRAKMYRCPAGYQTIGYGHNLDANPISTRAGQVILEDDIAEAEHQLLILCPWVTGHTPARQAALLDMMYNMGPTRLATFNEPGGSLEAIRLGEFTRAGRQLRQSKWYRDVGDRAEEDIRAIETGEES